MTGRNSHLFIIGHETLAAISEDEVKATVAGLREVGLFHLPYDRVSVRLPTNDCQIGFSSGIRPPDLNVDPRMAFTQTESGRWKVNLGPAHNIEIRNLNLLGEPVEVAFVHDGSDPKWRPYDIVERDAARNLGAGLRFTELLVALLATRNAVKETSHNKCARLGIGGKRPGSMKRFEYVTTISVPKILEDDDEHAPGVGKPKAPHLRRGHVRHRQHYGPRREFVKRIWIAPVFVNADRDFVSTRKAYNLCT